MKRDSLILLFCFLIVFSCKKPRVGYYSATFTDVSSGGPKSFQCHLDREKTRITIDNLSGPKDSHVSIIGELILEKDSVKGQLKYA